MLVGRMNFLEFESKITGCGNVPLKEGGGCFSTLLQDTAMIKTQQLTVSSLAQGQLEERWRRQMVNGTRF